MYRFSAQLFGITIFALGLVWLANPGDASQLSSSDSDGILWADTMHIDTDAEISPAKKKPAQSRDTFFKNVTKLTQTAFNIRNHYMEEVDAAEIVKAGVIGMLSNLDRFSVVMEPVAYDHLMEATHGKYQGLGMQIDARDDHIMIVAPIEGTPAYRKGLHAGDVIWEIDGKSTEGMKSSEAAKLMRGEAGTSVVLGIRRTGINDLMEFEVNRAVIELKSVNYSGILPGTDIGYVRLSRFAEETSRELREAISALNEQNVSSLIFDLRSNGGGLLDQAKETAELFLSEGKEIVYTKGRDASTERHYISNRPPLFPEDKPVVVLVDEGTASASEIVAGAIQDWDRGIILGAPTYGKGLVQHILKISDDESLRVKLTVAKYYVPSGRCIQRSDRQKKRGNHANITEEDAEADSLKLLDREIFYTNGGRIVYGGGGILPDIEVERELWKPIEINLERKSMFFDYAIQYVAANSDVPADLEITDIMVDEFKDFIKEKEFSYKSAMEIALDDLKETVTEEDKEPLFEKSLIEMDRLVDAEKEADFDKSLDYVKRAIKREIVSSVYGERGRYEQITFKSDKTVARAIELLSSPTEYSELMNEGKKKAEL